MLGYPALGCVEKVPELFFDFQQTANASSILNAVIVFGIVSSKATFHDVVANEHLRQSHGDMMRQSVQTIVFALVVCVSIGALAQGTPQDALREMNAEIARRNAEIERSRAETDRLSNWLDAQKTEKRLRGISQSAEQAAYDQTEAAKRAEEATEALRGEIEQSSVRARNYFYLGMLFLLTIGFVAYVVRGSNKEENMREHQKFGVVTIIVSALLTLFALMISDDWVQKFDLLQNVMLSLRIKFFDYIQEYNTLYYIDVPTRYVVLALICAAAYGLTTYLGITPVLRRKKKQQIQSAAPEAPQ